MPSEMAASILTKGFVMARKYGTKVERVEEQEEMVMYLGRSIPKEGFRAFIYSSDGQQKIAENWEEFEIFTSSDNWFATKEQAEAIKKPRSKKTEG